MRETTYDKGNSCMENPSIHLGSPGRMSYPNDKCWNMTNSSPNHVTWHNGRIRMNKMPDFSAWLECLSMCVRGGDVWVRSSCPGPAQATASTMPALFLF